MGTVGRAANSLHGARARGSGDLDSLVVGDELEGAAERGFVAVRTSMVDTSPCSI